MKAQSPAGAEFSRRDLIAGSSAAFAGALLPASAKANANDFPSQPIRIVVPLVPGSAPDFLARVIAAHMQSQWGQPAVVENRPGAAQNIGAEMVARAAPDGHTFLVAPPPPIAVNKHLYPGLKFDPDRFAPITIMCAVPNVVVARNDLPAKDMPAFIELIRKTKGGLNYGSTGVGSTLHLTTEAMRTRIKADLNHVPYKGTAEILSELLAGRIDFAVINMLDAWPHLSGKALRAMAIGSEKRDPSLPDVPTLAETWPGLISTTWFGAVAPPDTPKDICEKLSAAIRAALQAPDAAKRLADLKATPVLNTPDAAAKIIADDSKRWGDVIKANNIKGE